MPSQYLPILEGQILAETEKARAAIKVALQHARNAGLVYEQVRDLLTVAEVNAWLADKDCRVVRHDVMTARRISMCDDLDGKSRTLADLMFDAAAAHIAHNPDTRSRSERIEINKASHG